MSKTRVIVGLSALVWLLAATALADSDARIVRLSYLSGEVELDRRDGRGYEGGFLNMPVTESMRLWTRGDGFAEVELEDGSTLRLTPDTRVEFVELRRRSTGHTVTMVEFQEGTAYVDLRSGDDDFRLVFGRNQEVRIERSANFRITIDRSSLELAVTKGRVEVITAGGSVDVRKGETISFNVDSPSRYVLVDEVREARFDDWDRDREYERERYLARRDRDVRYPYSYGVADLHYYGTYVYVPGYGYVWRPSYVSTGWSPFQDGAWVWYPGYGYVWVSSYPWGWVPYRYGTWVYLNSHGWCWQPSSGGWQWAAVPRVRDRWPRGFDRPSGHNRGTVPIGRGYRDVWDEERDRARRDRDRDGDEGNIFTRARREGERRRAENNNASPAPPDATPAPPASEPAPTTPSADYTRRSGPSPAPDADGEGTIFERARREGDRRRAPPAPAPEATPAPAAPPESRPVPSPLDRRPSKPVPAPSTPSATPTPAPSTPPPSPPARSGWGSGSGGSSGSSDSGSRGSSRDATPTRERRAPK